MTLALLAILGGFILLVWSADRFVEGAAATAKHFGMPSLLIGMVIVGFGTSAPEMVVSAMAALDGTRIWRSATHWAPTSSTQA
ncbi:cation:H+ antiporter [Thalassospira xiamenensis]|uniref:Cation:H+ antiporter n=1 Tax=Thalassospira xiamenensis TaxID=220697 RepID=A0A285TMV4_9PROT|nr:cation:H+ antiporter [Thalassospira xiamenensis]